MISFGNFGTGKILYSSLKVHCKSPHSWPSSCGKKQFLHSRLRRSWRNCFSPRLLTHSWGDLQCTFRDSQKILNSYTRGFATRIGIFQSQNCQMISLGHSYQFSENLLIAPVEVIFQSLRGFYYINSILIKISFNPSKICIRIDQSL